MTIHDIIRGEIARCLERHGLFDEDLGIAVEKPRDKSHGDLSTNVAMVTAKRLGRKPRELAGELAAQFTFDHDLIESVEIAGPGFINFRLAPAYQVDLLLDIWSGEGALEDIRTGRGRRINVEFISANPTGPLNVVSARAGAFGATLVRLLDAVGYDAHAEYYVNDAGRQVRLLGASLRARTMEMLGHAAEFPEEGYKGRYISLLAEELVGLSSKAIQEQSEVFNDESFQRVTAPAGNSDDWIALPEDESVNSFAKYALMKILTWQRQTCRRFGLRFDTWYFESELHETKRVERALEKQRTSEPTFEEGVGAGLVGLHLNPAPERTLHIFEQLNDAAVESLAIQAQIGVGEQGALEAPSRCLALPDHHQAEPLVETRLPEIMLRGIRQLGSHQHLDGRLELAGVEQRHAPAEQVLRIGRAGLGGRGPRDAKQEPDHQTARHEQYHQWVSSSSRIVQHPDNVPAIQSSLPSKMSTLGVRPHHLTFYFQSAVKKPVALVPVVP